MESLGYITTFNQCQAHIAAKAPHLDSLSEHERVSICIYTSGLYRRITEDLYSGETDRLVKWKVLITSITSGLEKLPSYTGGILWRGTNSRNVEHMLLVKLSDSPMAFLITGLSTSRNESVARGFMRPDYSNPFLFEIKTTTGKSVQDLSLYPSEDEVMLPLFTVWKVGHYDFYKTANNISFYMHVRLDHLITLSVMPQ
eukprot:TRINITY_DN17017_c0_g1_i3.p1 TRINITY_DN17017_c0_g1~~TRINITY_DN17017_c0_g1_i3.p1  ORF type:complete len:225 (+),score=23.18 TRINITY_DN17017_c0_g1_i3:80-676(+)